MTEPLLVNRDVILRLKDLINLTLEGRARRIVVILLTGVYQFVRTSVIVLYEN